MGGNWNARWQSLGGGVYAGQASLAVPTSAINAWGMREQRRTPGTPELFRFPPFLGFRDGSFGMLSPGVPNTALQVDFAYRSEHMMAVIGKELVASVLRRDTCLLPLERLLDSGPPGRTDGADYPDDYDGILAGAPAIHRDRFQAAQIWY